MSLAFKKDDNVAKALETVLDEIKFVPGNKVFIKPNLCGREPIRLGENTSLEVMDALVDWLRTRGSYIMIGHGSLLGSHDHKFDFDDVIRSSGFIKYKNKEGIELINLDNEEREEVKIEELSFHLPLKLLGKKIDTYINLAKVKTHMETTVSFSLKNQMGFPAPDDRVSMHRTDLEDTIAKLACYCRPDISILEGYPAMENNGPHHGTTKDLNMMAASTDMVKIDSAMAWLLGYNPDNIKHLVKARELQVGDFISEEERKTAKQYLVNDFQPAQQIYEFGKKIKAYPTYSCSRCITAVNKAGREFKEHPIKYWRILYKAFFSRENINIIFGRADKMDINPKGKIICIGQCSNKFAESIGKEGLIKCPPGVDEVREYLVKHILE